LAYLTESYKYFANIEKRDFSGSEVNSILAKYDLSYDLNKDTTINPVIDFTQNKGEGTSIEKVKRQIVGFSLLLKHQVSQNLLFEASARQEVTTNYQSPLLYNLGFNYKVFMPYTVKINASKNFRIPTFNDLYWETGGNLDLLPETALQYEMSHELDFNWVQFNISGYYNAIDSMIRWTPNSDGLWSPQNVDEVETYGLESQLTLKKYFGNHQLRLNGTYGYTVSENKLTGRQLTYVPFHKFNSSLSYNYKRITAFYEFLFVDDVFTTTDHNNKFNVDAYYLSNVGAEYTFKSLKQTTLGIKVKNIANFDYESFLGRHMPGINFNTYLNIKF
jgi:iron complex outermembrane receptor protein